MSLEFSGALDSHLLTGSGYWDEEYDEPEPVCEKCGGRLLPLEEEAGICRRCADEEEETLDEEE